MCFQETTGYYNIHRDIVKALASIWPDAEDSDIRQLVLNWSRTAKPGDILEFDGTGLLMATHEYASELTYNSDGDPQIDGDPTQEDQQ